MQYVVIENPGLENERLACWKRFPRRSAAWAYIHDLVAIEAEMEGLEPDDLEGRYDVMGECPDGTLTTEI